PAPVGSWLFSFATSSQTIGSYSWLDRERHITKVDSGVMPGNRETPCDLRGSFTIYL
ncbi:hypothetical protein QQF64_000293, partial [Cirrhinus molitorella]